MDLGTSLGYWVDENAGKIFCLVDAESAADAGRVHREAHGLVADDATVSDAQSQSRQATGADGRGAADGQADGADVLLDLPELGYDIVADDEDVGVDVTDDVDVGRRQWRVTHPGLPG